MKDIIPIIAIDGTTASGKGTIANMLVKYFNFNYLNSGALYRIVAYRIKQKNINITDELEITKIGASIAPIFLQGKIILDGEDIWPIIKTQEYGNLAAKISSIKSLREALFKIQRDQIKSPGLIAEGRDMTSHVFPDAQIKIYLDSDIDVRVERRYLDELNKKRTDNNHIVKTKDEIKIDIEKRDYSDMNREYGKLRRTDDSFYVDSSKHSGKEETFEICKNYCENKLKELGLL